MRLFTFAMVLFSIQIFAQNRIPGTIIVQLHQNENVSEMIHHIQLFEKKETHLQIGKKLSPSLNIYTIIFDENCIHPHDFLAYVKTRKEVDIAQFDTDIQKRETVPNDELFINQFQYVNSGVGIAVEDADMDADEAWDITTGGLTALGDTIVVCVVDDGIDIDHEDLVENIYINHGEVENNNIDDDNNGYVDDYYGWNTYTNNDNISVGGSHGTPVAGIIGAKGNNEIGVCGVNWNVKLMIVVGGGNQSGAIESYSYCLEMRKKYNDTHGVEGAFVVATNSSWGINYGQPSQAPLWCAFYDTLGEEGILSCGATANADINVDIDGDLPTGCDSDYLISVTNIRNTDEKEQEAGYGTETIDLGSYGTNAFTVAWNNGYGGFGGTSGATPQVSGAIGLLYSTPCNGLAEQAISSPASTALIIRDFILQGTEAISSLDGITTTGGKLNLNNSVMMAVESEFCGACAFEPQIIIDPIDCVGENGLIIVSFFNSQDAIFQWEHDPMNITSVAVVNEPGFYNVKVTDQEGCTRVFNNIEVVDSSTAISFETSTEMSTDGGDGSATVEVSGGVEPIIITWDDTNAQSGNTATELPAGLFEANIETGDGCEYTITVEVEGVASGIEDVSNSSVFIIYPNPVTDKIIVESDFSEYQILNIEGKLVQEGMATNEINTMQIPKGMYYLVLQHNKVNKVGKFIVQ